MVHIAEPSSVTAFAVTHISHYWNLSYWLLPAVAAASTLNRRHLPRRPSPITTHGEDVRLRDVPFIEYLYTIQLSLKEGRSKGTERSQLVASRSGIGCQSQTRWYDRYQRLEV